MYRRVDLAEDILLQADKFAQLVVPTTNYADSNQTNSQKIYNDHFTSKLGEAAVAQHYRSKSAHVIGPDYNIYFGRYKSWDEDLVVNSIPVAVKTQNYSSMIKYGLSWTFQCSPKRTDPVLTRPESIVHFVLCRDDIGYKTCLIFEPIKIKDLIFKPPKSPHLLHKKKVVYAHDHEIFEGLSITNHN